MHRGYIKLYRAMMDNHLWGHKPFSYGQAWAHMLMVANHKEGTIWVNNHLYKVDRGQIGKSQETLQADFGWTRGQMRTFIKHLKHDLMISLDSAGKSSIITILNYSKYHDNDLDDNHETTMRQPRDNHETTANKNDKNNKNVKKEDKPLVSGDKITFNRSTRKFDGITPDYLSYLKGQYPAVDVDGKLREMETWLDANPKNQKSNYKRFITNWLKREQDKAPRVDKDGPDWKKWGKE